MQNTNVYLALIDGAISIRTEQPSESHVTLCRLTAEAGKVLTKGTETRYSVDVNLDEVSAWTEADDDSIPAEEALTELEGAIDNETTTAE